MPSSSTKILICPLPPEFEIAESEEVTVTRSRMNCLQEAATGDFELIVIRFSTRNISIRKGIIDLCTCLREHPLTRETPLLVSMDHHHRDMILRMKHADVGFVEVRQGITPIDPESMARVVRDGGGALCIDRVLTRLCPFLAYAPIDDRSELITCRAYRNRMVLGGKRLHEVCETEDCQYCEYFSNPRVRA